MAKYYRIKVHHLPSGKLFFSDGVENKEDDLSIKDKKETLGLLKMAGEGKVTYLSLEREGDIIVIPKPILLESVFTLENFGD